MASNLNANLFKKYDIRGQAEGAGVVLTTVAAAAIGRAFGTYVQHNHALREVVVGRDNRASSPALQEALMEGLGAAGCEVVNLGPVATPVVYWHAVTRGDVAGVMVTGSHLAADQNGFKLCVGNRTLHGDEIQALRHIIESDTFSKGGGSQKTDETAAESYTHDLAGRIPADRSLRVVIDSGNGIGGLFGPQLIQAWGHEVIECLYCEPDAAYPNHQPDPQNAANMRDLSAKVRETQADVGIAFDGDADRMGAVDENGDMIAADRLLALLAIDMLRRNPGEAVVADVLSSQVLFDVVREHGGEAFMAPSGHSLVKDAMRDHAALLGGEMSGHIFLGENYFGYDDGFLAAGRLLQVVAASDKTLSQLDADLPRLYSTPEYRPHCPDEMKQRVIDGVTEALKDEGDVVTIDGLRIQFDRGWGLLRASNTEPVLSLRFEGETEANALAYKTRFEDVLKSYPEVGALE